MNFSIDDLTSIALYGGLSLVLVIFPVLAISGYFYYQYKQGTDANNEQMKLEGVLARSVIYSLSIITLTSAFIILIIIATQSPYIAKGIYYFFTTKWTPELFNEIISNFTDPTVKNEAITLTTIILIEYLLFIIFEVISVGLVIFVFSVSYVKCRTSLDNSTSNINFDCFFTRAFYSTLFIVILFTLIEASMGSLYTIVKTSNAMNITNLPITLSQFEYMTKLREIFNDAITILQQQK
ncbi:hypothetical protein [Caminibacter pacificus]|uniref:Transmembrane protein n=1 Tax=Caminibacter pacificus TaxID=1424653 RepID=A0AAJ4RAN2_9BACT|nr:hypothetical protein [Caminibacter pacificus]QDD68223.1 hypothetical protein C6V80_10230 [Caminibacter pacificus]ROR38737.1 hypothetical protein EDC58_1952 [Caminibacter pacificus]